MPQINFRVNDDEALFIQAIAEIRGISAPEIAKQALMKTISPLRVDIAFQLLKDGKIGRKHAWKLSGVSYYEFLQEWTKRGAEEIINDEAEAKGLEFRVKTRSQELSEKSLIISQKSFAIEDKISMSMMIDLSAWMHIFTLIKDNRFDFRPLLQRYVVSYTAELQHELESNEYRNLWNKEQYELTIISEEKIVAYLSNNFALPEFDAINKSVIIAASETQALILTDDSKVFLQCLALELPVIRFPHFCLKLALDGEITWGDFSFLGLYWDQKNRYTKKEISSWQKARERIQSTQSGI